VNRFKRWLLGEVNGNLEWINVHLLQIRERIVFMSASTDLLVAEVAELKTVVDSAVLLIQGIADRFKNVTTMAEVEAVVADLEAQKTALADAVTQNT
jgi:hypothetical protein